MPRTVLSRHSRAVFSFAALAFATAPVAGQSVRVGVDPRIELLSIVFRLAGNAEYNQGRLTAYDSAIDAHFGRFRQHPAVLRAQQLRTTRSVSFDAVMSFAIHVADVETLAERLPFDAPESSLEQRWPPAEARLFLADLRQFVTDTDFAGFLRSHQVLHDTATARARRLIEAEVDLPWFRDWYGEEPRGGFVLAPGLVNGGGNYGPRFRDRDGTEEVWAVLGVWLTDSAGLPRFDRTLVSTVVHEFSHSFVNHVAAARRSAFRPAAGQIFERVEGEMRSMAYSNWGTMVDESLVRAAVARYVLAHSGPEAAQAELRAQQARGFLWLRGLFELLAEYESDRDRYPTFASFMPRIEVWYETVPAQFDSLQASFDEGRPLVASVSPPDGARDVDPATSAIVVRFDQPMARGYNVNAGPGGRDRFPQVEGASFNDAGTEFTMRVRLEPEREYEFELGPGFRSASGFPLKARTIRFRTGPARKTVAAAAGAGRFETGAE